MHAHAALTPRARLELGRLVVLRTRPVASRPGGGQQLDEVGAHGLRDAGRSRRERIVGTPKDPFPGTATALLLLAGASGWVDEAQPAAVLTAAGRSGRGRTGVHRDAVRGAAAHVDEVLDLVGADVVRGVGDRGRPRAGSRSAAVSPTRPARSPVTA